MGEEAEWGRLHGCGSQDCIAGHNTVEQSIAKALAGGGCQTQQHAQPPSEAGTKSEAGAPCYLLPIISHAIKPPVLTFSSKYLK